MWPESKSFGCSHVEGAIWQLLTTNMDTNSTTGCEFLCRLRGEDGCCYLHDGSTDSQKKPGCWWKARTQAFEGEDSSSATGIAITCTEIGRLISVDKFSNQPKLYNSRYTFFLEDIH